MAVKTVNTAAGNATPAPAGGLRMSAEQFERQTDYSTIMSLVREMLDSSLISPQEFSQIEAMYAKFYQPIFRLIGEPESRQP